ncbi:GNAT family N-acetyltransferase [Streptomyces fragilis]|uniref:GNAT family N-acetyltransferase n=1 Tax=Streptomyces fragilis TaxID=67301 RepID=A0ABV2YC73_9ACTN|nr:GNAT family N-acetyltransferase [Streptomyces fragilis]
MLTEHVGALTSALCEELAELGQRCIRGFSDDRPVDAALVWSRLVNALTGEPPVLVLARAGGGLVGWCAVRRPEPGEAQARLWGPVVCPSARRSGLGKQLLEQVVSAVPWPVMSTDVPEDRPGAVEFFSDAGWHVLETATVLHGTPTGDRLGAAERVPALAEYVAAAAQQYGGHAPHFAAATLMRWRDDARFREEHLLLDPPTGSLLLALPQRAAGRGELLLAELWAAPEARQRLIRAAHAVAGREGLRNVRAVVRRDSGDFAACSMRVVGRCHTFVRPGDHTPGHLDSSNGGRA